MVSAVSLGNPALASRRELELVRPSTRALLVQVLDRVSDVLHRRGPFRRHVFEPVLRLLALDDGVDDQERNMYALVAELSRLRLDECARRERRRRPRAAARIAPPRRAARDLHERAAPAAGKHASADPENVEDRG